MSSMRNPQSAICIAQSAMRNLHFSWTLCTAYCVLIMACCALPGCAPQPSGNEEFSFTPIPRLAKYYPEVDANGDTTYKKPPSGTFTDQYGNDFSTSQFSGSVQVVQIFFTSCLGICPVITNNMATVQKEFAGNPDVKLISFSVDPERDSAAALKSYAERFHVDSTQWRLLTGDKKFIYDIIRYGYMLPDIEPGNGGEEDFIHSDQLVLIDRNNIIRGYYDGTDTAQVRVLIEDVHVLLKEK